jgi:MoaA/NifB/PqqE/SkfB family radical SAM enzyme
MSREANEGATNSALRLLWAELGLECQIECLHCYAGAGPRRGFGAMTADDWERVITEAVGLGVERVTFIGGEPTLHPALSRLVRLVVNLGRKAEIYSNMVRVTPALWELFELPGVSLAASWYTSNREEHAAITGGHDTWRQTRANVARTVKLGIPIRVGMVDGIVPGQRTDGGERELRELGVSDIGRDRLREFGRGTVAAPSQACGRCGHGRAAVLPDGTVTPCPMTRFLATGNVRETSLGKALEAMPGATTGLPRPVRACDPDDDNDDIPCSPLCTPNACKPWIE